MLLPFGEGLFFGLAIHRVARLKKPMSQEIDMRDHLDIVNYVLAQLGSAPVAALSIKNPDVESAKARVDEASATLQKSGWWFNTDLNVKLLPDANTKIVYLPAQTLKIMNAGEYLINRTGRAYSPFRQSSKFDAPVHCSIVRQAEIWELPLEARDYIAETAAISAILSELEDRNKAQELQRPQAAAMLELKKADLEIKRRSVYASPTILNRRIGVRPYRLTGGSTNPNLPGG
jgi:hypothetical protein